MDEVLVEAGVEIFNANVDKLFRFGKKLYGSREQKNKIKDGYDRYIMNSRVHYSKLKSLWSNGTPIDFYECYVPVGLSLGLSTSMLEPDFLSCIDISHSLIITGTGGCGKSILMRHIFLGAIKSGKYAPVLVELRDINDSVRSLEEHILFVMQNRGFDIDGGFFKQAIELGEFCFLFDGFDEVLASKREAVGEFINSLSLKYPGCPVIVSTRPDERFRTWDLFTELHVEPLSKAAAIELVDKLPVETIFKEKFIKELKDSLFNKHESFLSNPLLLSIMLLTYHQNAEIPTKLSVFYEQAYEALFQKHDASKGAYSRKRATDLDILDFARVFSFFSLLTFDKRIFSMGVSECLDYIEQSKNRVGVAFDRKCYLDDLLKATCLLVEDGLQVTYAHRSFQEYFVSRFILSEEYAVQVRLIKRYWRPYNNDAVISLLYEQNPELVERALLVPELEKVFNDIGVCGEVGDEAVLRYLKSSYSVLRVESGQLIFHLAKESESDGVQMKVLSLANKLCCPLKVSRPGIYEQLSNSICEAVGCDKDSNFKMSTSELNIDSEVFKLLCNSEGHSGKAFLSKVYQAYLDLVRKHERRVDDLFALLTSEKK